MDHVRGITCQITAFQVPDPPSEPDASGRKWLAVATAHVYDPKIELPGLKPGQAALVGETMRVIDGRAAADTEAQAMAAALQALLFQLTAKGYSANHDVKLW
ncbi:hypothetical protein [Sorangium sp. So ce233]|uniref:hypothetical protein n=1 Tax=Sorangium sp. So ce233 TaxID=3133290 RepID=UPI003F60B691